MDEPARRAWSRSELVVLIRGGSEETVLTVCKANVQPGSPASVHYGCAARPEVYLPCHQNCGSSGTS